MELKAQVVTLSRGHSDHPLVAAVRHLEGLEDHGVRVLRWGLIGLTHDTVLLEVTTVSGSSTSPAGLGADAGTFPTARPVGGSGGIFASLVIPTGVGAVTGGFIGDSGPVARALAAASDNLLLHPNVVTGADFYAGERNVYYADGFTLDRFFLGATSLVPGRSARIGVVIDVLDELLQVDVLNACNAMKAVAGLDLVGFARCAEKIKAEVTPSPVGHFLGRLSNPDAVFEAADRLVTVGADAIAVVTDIGGFSRNDLSSHYAGIGANPVGATEAMISRALTWWTGLPCAHAPAFTNGVGRATSVTDPRAAAEVASGTGVPSVLYGLSRAARAVPQGGLNASDLSAIIVPFGAAGGPPALAAERFEVPLVAVRSNRTVVGVNAEALSTQCVTVENYGEALGFLACLRAGVAWSSVIGPVARIEEVPRPGASAGQPLGGPHSSRSESPS